MNKVAIMIGSIFALTACGYSHRNNEMVGQPKQVLQATPLICPDRTDLSLSLGVMVNGVGSMSHEDVMVNIP